MEKVSVTLDEDVVAQIRELVGSRQFSAYVNNALKRHVKRDQMRRLLAEMDEEFGPVPDDVRAGVNAEKWPF